MHATKVTRIFSRPALLLALVFLLAACGSSGGSGSNTPSIIKIGSLHPLTGALAADGKQMDEAIKMAVDDINAAGGIKALNGAKLQVDSGDSQGKPDVAQSEAQRLIQDGVVAIVGTYTSGTAAIVSQVAERSQVPFVIDVAAADDILSHGYQYTFRLQPNASVMGKNGADYLTQVAGSAGITIHSIAYIHEQTDFGTSVSKAFESEAQAHGISTVADIKYDAFPVSDLTLQVTQAAAAHPDVIVVTGYYNDGLVFAKAAATVKPKVKAIYGVADGAFDLPQFPGDAGSAGSFYLSSNYHFNATTASKVRDAFKAKYGQEMRTPAVFSYQAVQVIAQALEKAQTTDRTKLRAAIAGTSLSQSDTLLPHGIHFDSKGENTDAIPIVMQVQNNQVVQVYPQQFAQAKPTFPATPWSGSGV